jgi:hypothetical protein
MTDLVSVKYFTYAHAGKFTGKRSGLSVPSVIPSPPAATTPRGTDAPRNREGGP